MAPAGSWESLQAAIQAGADSVYFGIERLNMRSRSSSNFTTEDLHRIVERCKEAGIKSYLTINTIIYDEDLELMREIVDNAKEAGVSAIIAADVAVMQYAISQGVEVHLSTQLNISNVEALRFYAKFADVVVLARELNMDTDAYLEALIVASLMKRSNLSETDAINAGSAELASGIEDYFFEEMFENHTDHYKQMLNSAV